MQSRPRRLRLAGPPPGTLTLEIAADRLLSASKLGYRIPSPIRDPWRRVLASFYRRRRERRARLWRGIFGEG